MANKRYYADIRQMAKQANQRMVRLEKAGIKSPAYEMAQGFLELSGRKGSDFRGRRFSETGKMDWNTAQIYRRELKQFLYGKHGRETSTKRGYENYRNDIWNTSNERYNLDELGLSKDEWFEIWRNMSNKKKDRIYGSETVIEIVSTITRLNKHNPTKVSQYYDDGKLNIEEVIKAINSATGDLKSAYASVGLKYSDISTTRRKLGKL